VLIAVNDDPRLTSMTPSLKSTYRDVVVTRLLPGEFFGDENIFKRDARIYKVRCISLKGQVFGIPYDVFTFGKD
jgi:CRP-like cAMP-binding protein